jgi:hypothetical protein
MGHLGFGWARDAFYIDLAIAKAGRRPAPIVIVLMNWRAE